ncbi:hypothetical protein ES703_89831 [subsurface metagenome]
MLSGQYRGGDWSAAPVFRQKGGMEINSAVGKNIQEILLKDPAKNNNDQNFRPQCPDFFYEGFIKRGRLQNTKTQFQGFEFNRGWFRLLFPACRPVRVGQNPADFMLPLHRLQWRHSEGGASCKENPHQSGFCA